MASHAAFSCALRFTPHHPSHVSIIQPRPFQQPPRSFRVLANDARSRTAADFDQRDHRCRQYLSFQVALQMFACSPSIATNSRAKPELLSCSCLTSSPYQGRSAPLVSQNKQSPAWPLCGATTPDPFRSRRAFVLSVLGRLAIAAISKSGIGSMSEPATINSNPSASSAQPQSPSGLESSPEQQSQPRAPTGRGQDLPRQAD